MNTNCAIDLVSPERLQRIRELAQKATPGPWKVSGKFTCQVVVDYQPQKGRAGGYGSGDDFVCFLNDGENGTYNDEKEQTNTAAYIAAVYPGVVLAMCEEIARLRKQVALLDKEAKWLAEHIPKTSMIDGKAKVQCLRGMQEWRETARKAAEEICKK